MNLLGQPLASSCVYTSAQNFKAGGRTRISRPHLQWQQRHRDSKSYFLNSHAPWSTQPYCDQVISFRKSLEISNCTTVDTFPPAEITQATLSGSYCSEKYITATRRTIWVLKLQIRTCFKLFLKKWLKNSLGNTNDSFIRSIPDQSVIG